MKNNKLMIIGILFLGIQLSCFLASGQNENSEANQYPDFQLSQTRNLSGPDMTFDKEFIELGEVKKGDKRVLFYDLTNTGDEPLEIELISACDCTTTTYPNKPIQPGETIRIDVVFDSSEKEESEDIDIDIFFTNIDQDIDAPLIRTVKYHFDLIK